MSKKPGFQNKKLSMNVDQAMTYLILLTVPVVLPMILVVYYQSCGMRVYQSLLVFPQILFNGLSACSFYYYITHSRQRQVASKGAGIPFSFAYGFSSYLLVQESDLRLLALYALLPLLYLGYESFLTGKKSLPYVLLLAICFIIEPATATVLALYFCLVFFFETERTFLGELMADLLHLLCLTAFAFLLPGFLALPKLHDHFIAYADVSYGGFYTTYPLLTFFSRFLPGSVSFRAFDSFPGLCMCAGLFLIIGIVLYFINPEEKRSERIRNLICLLILLCCLEFSPLRYLPDFLSPVGGLTVSHSFFALFWLLRLSVRGWMQARECPRKRITRALLGIFLFLTLVFCGTAHSFHPVSIAANYLLLAFYGALLLHALRGEQPKISSALQKLGIALVLAELLFNAFLCTNSALVPSAADTSVQYVWNRLGNSGTENTATAAPLPNEEAYTQFRKTHYDLGFVLQIGQLYSGCELTDADKAAINPYSLCSTAEEINYLCQKIGAEGLLLTPMEELEINFEESDFYRIDSCGHSFYNLLDTPAANGQKNFYLRADITIPENRPVILFENTTGSCFKLSPEKAEDVVTCYLRVPNFNYVTVTLQPEGFYLDEELLRELPDLLQAYAARQAAAAVPDMTPYYAGILCTAIGLLLLLCFTLNRDRQRLIDSLANLKRRIQTGKLWKAIVSHCQENRVYYLAFLLPFSLFVLTLIYFSCEPFGSYSLLDQDGITSILSDYLSFAARIRRGNYLYSMNAGFGGSMFPFNLFHLPLALLTVGQVSTAMVLAVGLMTSASALSTVWYLTHRLSAPAADKSDLRLLAPAMIYSLNSFMLAMHGYVDWFGVYMVLPLLFLALDRLIYQKKWLTYVLLLSFCMYTNIQLALYVCIALFFLFFTYRFKNVKDFFQKGIRFALCSLLCVANAFISVGGNFLYVAGGTAYASDDSIAPTFGFFGSFADQWKNLMVFSPVVGVTSSNLQINFYVGVLTLPLMAAYFLSSRQDKKSRLQRLILLALLLFSFNEQVIAYVINGMHYQNKVPNRHAFLFTFLCAVIAYDGILALAELSRRKILALFGGTLCFFAICQLCSSGNPASAFFATLGILVLCAALYLLCRSKNSDPAWFSGLVCTLLAMELAANLFYVTSTYNLKTISLLGDYSAKNTYYKETLGLSDSRYRAITPAIGALGSGTFTDTPGITAFTPYLGDSAKRLTTLYGYYAGTNTIDAHQTATLMANALSAVKYIMIKQTTSPYAFPDLAQYTYIGQFDNVYIFENPWVLPLGFYMPEEPSSADANGIDLLAFHNELAAFYCPSDTEPLLDVHAFSREQEAGKSSCKYLDQNGRELSQEEALRMVETAAASDKSSFPIQSLSMELTIYPATDGYVYLYDNEFIPLGMGKAGEPLHKTIYYPNLSAPGNELWVTFHQDTFEAFYEEAMKNVPEDIVVKDNHFTATTNYEKAGYTMFSLPYDAEWKAYLDGKEVPVTSPYNAFLLVETPAGRHQLELVHNVPSSTKWCIAVSLASLLFTFLLYGVSRLTRKRSQPTAKATAKIPVTNPVKSPGGK